MRTSAPLPVSVALALFAVTLGAGPLNSQSTQEAHERSALEQAHLARTRQRFGHALWIKGPTHAGLPLELPLEGWVGGQLQSVRGRLTRLYAPAAAPNAPAPLLVESFVADSSAAAHEQLVEWLAGAQSPERILAARELALDVGDVAFTTRPRASDAPLTWVAFVRGNVAVQVRWLSTADGVRPDLRELSQRIDQAVLKAPLLEAGAAPAKPQVRGLSLSQSLARAGQVLDLTFDVLDPAGGAPHLEWVIAGTGQGYVERSDAGVWQFHSTGPGEVKLTLEVTSSLGTFASAEVALTLTDD